MLGLQVCGHHCGISVSVTVSRQAVSATSYELAFPFRDEITNSAPSFSDIAPTLIQQEGNPIELINHKNDVRVNWD